MIIEYVFNLGMSYQEFCDVYYSKGYQQVVVTTVNGTRVALPAGRLIPFIDTAFGLAYDVSPTTSRTL